MRDIRTHMGNYFTITTHEQVPEEVKSSVAPIEFTPVTSEEMDTVTALCEDCGEYFGWWVPATNCSWCGVRRCQRCAPKRYLLGDRPGCRECTQTAFQLRRSQMLQSHYNRVGVQQPVPTIPISPSLAKRLYGSSSQAGNADTPLGEPKSTDEAQMGTVVASPAPNGNESQ